MKKPWVDLGENCKDFKQYGNMEKGSCFSCEHYIVTGGNPFYCELQNKEKERKMLEAVRYEGQLILVPEVTSKEVKK